MAEWQRQLQRISASIEEMAERQEPKLTRSGMTTRQKCDFIREFGETAYLALPWGKPR